MTQCYVENAFRTVIIADHTRRRDVYPTLNALNHCFSCVSQVQFRRLSYRTDDGAGNFEKLRDKRIFKGARDAKKINK